MNNVISQVGIIGYGNVGSHLSRIFQKVEDLKLTVYNRSSIPQGQNPENIHITGELQDLATSELVILAVKDDAIIPVLEQIKDIVASDTIVCHCSGSTPSEVIKPYFKNYGVLYPLQTFSTDKSIDYTEIPLFITGSDPATTQIIKNISQYISPKTYEIDDNQRISLHISAVFCCNYTNAMYAIGQKICTDHDLNFDHLLPLIEETANKIKQLPPQKAQTGPAMRGDWKIVHQQETYLTSYDKQITTLYRQLADYINQNL